MLNIGERGDARVIYEHIAAAELGHRLIKDRFALVKDGNVSLHCEGLTAHAAYLFCDGFGLIAVDVYYRNIGTALGKAESEGLADAVGAAGDDYFSVFVVCEHRFTAFLNMNFMFYQSAAFTRHFDLGCTIRSWD